MRRGSMLGIVALAGLLAAGALPYYSRPVRPPAFEAPPGNVAFDYQIGRDYPPPGGVGVVSRDWFLGQALGPDGYSVCYVNAFQTQPDDPDTDRPDEASAWPAELVLTELEDPNFEGEYLIDISTVANRQAAADWVEQMIATCAEKGFGGVEYDNLDSWTRYDGTEREGEIPFGRDEAIAFAGLLADLAHQHGMAAGQKNTVDLGRDVSVDVIGFDFAVVEECGAFDECTVLTDVFEDRVLAVEYTDEGFAAACEAVGATISVVRRDVEVSAPGSDTYVYDEC